MMASRPWLLWAAPFALTAILAPLLALVPLEVTIRLLCVAVALSAAMLALQRVAVAEEGWAYAASLGARLVVGSLLSGAFALLFLITFYPKPGIANLLWMIGIPILVALGQPRRELATIVPFVVFGWVAFALLGWVLQVPVD